MTSAIGGGIGAMPAEPAVHACPHQKRSGSVAALLEVIPGLFFSTFGIGHIYAGNVAAGLMVMIGFWVLLAINIVLCFVLIGFVTLPLTWLLTLVLSTMSAARACDQPCGCASRN